MPSVVACPSLSPVVFSRSVSFSKPLQLPLDSLLAVVSLLVSPSVSSPPPSSSTCPRLHPRRSVVLSFLVTSSQSPSVFSLHPSSITLPRTVPTQAPTASLSLSSSPGLSSSAVVSSSSPSPLVIISGRASLKPQLTHSFASVDSLRHPNTFWPSWPRFKPTSSLRAALADPVGLIASRVV